MSKMYFMIGVARSGKSTYCNNFVKTHSFYIQGADEKQLTLAIVCSDSIRLALTGHRFFSAAEAIVQGIKHTMIRSLLERGHDVVVDGTHTTEKSIRELLEIDPTAEYILLDTDEKTCVQRALDTGQPDLIPVIQRMRASLDKLKSGEGLDAKIERWRKEITNSASYNKKVVL